MMTERKYICRRDSMCKGPEVRGQDVEETGDCGWSAGSKEGVAR